MKPNRSSKLGLALSGGGFRAALFHLGVLARLADFGLLRHVEVISTVSGGSIIGALYYVHLKRLLESKPDADITDDDYRDMLRTVEKQFIYGVQQNLRMRTFSNPWKNWRMRRPDYSRSDRMGELYDTYFFGPTFSKPPGEMVRMNELKIFPFGESKQFHPRRDNVHRSAKVPILLLNATSLNTGRNWRFEASRMGEPPRTGRIAYDVDKVTRLLRPPSYESLPEHLYDMELGLAVAASTAVPGLFVPLSLSRLYPERRIELVDGGIHDNQGLQGLIDEGCQRFIVSDASGQMDEARKPSTALAGVLSRINSVLMHRVREEQLFSATTNDRENAVGLIHMRKGLTPETVPWINATEKATDAASRPIESGNPRVDEDVQTLLAHVRTDLDSFTEVESYSLMQLGYTLSGPILRRTPGIAEMCRPAASTPWQFRQIQPWMERPTHQFLEQLRVASGSLFKVFRLKPWLRTVLVIFGIVTVGCVMFFGQDWLLQRHELSLSWKWWHVLAIGAAGIVAFVGRSKPLRHMLRWARRPLDWAYRLVFRAIVPFLIAPIIHVYLLTFDRLFLAQGRVSRLDPPETTGRRRPWRMQRMRTPRQP